MTTTTITPPPKKTTTTTTKNQKKKQLKPNKKQNKNKNKKAKETETTSLCCHNKTKTISEQLDSDFSNRHNEYLLLHAGFMATDRAALLFTHA